MPNGYPALTPAYGLGSYGRIGPALIIAVLVLKLVLKVEFTHTISLVEGDKNTNNI